MNNFVSSPYKKRCFIGFDGFIDSIISVVDQREEDGTIRKIPSIEAFGKRILAAGGRSCNLELITHETKIGGNGPIMAEALLNLGHSVTLAGTFSSSEVDILPLFSDLSNRCERLISLGNSAFSDALEFHDGKVILGKHSTLNCLSYEKLLRVIGEEELVKILEEIDLLAMVNWTMLPGMTQLWQELQTQLLPRLPKRDKLPFLFIDLADPAKRSDNELFLALSLLEKFSGFFLPLLGLNLSEAERVLSVLGAQKAKTLPQIATSIASKLPLHQIIIHTKGKSVSICKGECYQASAPINPTPKLTTGAGDNFNAGYCHGLLTGKSCEEALHLGMRSAGYYVEYGKSPTTLEISSRQE